MGCWQNWLLLRWVKIHLQVSRVNCYSVLLWNVNICILGTLPTQLGSLTNLVALSISGMKINGAWNVSIVHWIYRICVCLGTIPSFIGSLTNIAFIYAASNVFTGWYVKWTCVLFFTVFTRVGVIPTAFGLLTKLSYLELSVNKLAGTWIVLCAKVISLGNYFIVTNRHNSISICIVNVIEFVKYFQQSIEW